MVTRVDHVPILVVRMTNQQGSGRTRSPALPGSTVAPCATRTPSTHPSTPFRPGSTTSSSAPGSPVSVPSIKLTEAGEHDHVLIERGHDVGGTWRDNTYPGAACDVPSQLYSFSFAPNPAWSRSFSPQPEILAYLRQVAAAHGIGAADQLRDDAHCGGAGTRTRRSGSSTPPPGGVRARTLDHRHGRPVGAPAAGHRGPRGLPRRPVPLRALGPRPPTLQRQAGRRHRDRRLGHPDRARGREVGRPRRRPPAHRAVRHPAQRPPVHPPRAPALPARPRAGPRLPGRDLLGPGDLRPRLHLAAAAGRAGEALRPRPPGPRRRRSRPPRAADPVLPDGLQAGASSPTTTTRRSRATTSTW